MVTMVTMISHSVAVKDLCNKGTVTCSKHLECVNLYTQILTDVGLLINQTVLLRVTQLWILYHQVILYFIF